MVLMEVDQEEKLRLRQVRESIASMPLDKFFDYFSCMEEDAVWWSFNIKNLDHKWTGGLYIWTKEKYTVFTGIISKSDAKKTVYLRLANSEKDNKDEEEDFLA